jgi:hypothetical protein
MNARSASSSACMSNSVKCGTRAPVSASMISVGLVSSSESASVSCVGQPVSVAPGRCVIGDMPIDQPSRSS